MNMKKIQYIFILTLAIIVSSCNDWLDIIPKNEQATPEYWQTKEDVEAVLTSGYYYMRECTPYYIDWGELRAGSVSLYILTNNDKDKLRRFSLTSNQKICQWSTFYQVINMANSVIDNAGGVVSKDPTYTEAAMNSHKTEAYFMRALTYFYLVRNFKEVPLILTAYVDDSTPYDYSKSSEEVIIEQIKKDITDALATGAAKEVYDQVWENKGRATKWALYALMADVCLWSEDYEGCVTYADYLINASAPIKPVFISDPTKWFEIFYPGNSNESIFELNWDQASYQETSKSPSLYFGTTITSTYCFGDEMTLRLFDETIQAGIVNSVRSYFGAYVGTVSGIPSEKEGLVWKYTGTGYRDLAAVRVNADGNYIIYRMADVMLMKAEALIQQGEAHWGDALEIINAIRTRSNLRVVDIDLSDETELSMLELVLNERDMELAAEGKRWYDLMRFGKSKNYKYKKEFIEYVVLNNGYSQPQWIRSVLENPYAWYLPINEEEMKTNKLLEQNPYYKETK